MRNFFISILILNLFGSCSLIRNGFIGTTNPKIETPKSIMSFIKSENLDGDKIFTIAPDSFHHSLNYLFFGVFIFDWKGNYLSFGSSKGKYCFNSLDDSIKNLNPLIDTGHTSSNYSLIKRMNSLDNKNFTVFYDTIHLELKTLSNQFRNLDGTDPSFSASNSDYVLLIPFALYYGRKIQTKEMRRYIKATQKNKGVTFQIVLLNLDKQEWWGEDWNERNNFKVE